MSTLIIIDHTTAKPHLPPIQDLSTTYTLHLPTKKTTSEQFEAVATLRQSLSIQKENHLTISFGSIIQKTWRIIKHYSANEATPKKHTPHRTHATNDLTQKNRTRLHHIETSVRQMIITDQATKLNAQVIDLTYASTQTDSPQPTRHITPSQPSR